MTHGPPPWEPSWPTRTGPVEADGAVDAQNAPTAPWKTRSVFHELPQGLSHQITHEKHRKAPKIALGNPDRPRNKGHDFAARHPAWRALLLGHKCPMCSLAAPGQPGAAPRINTPYFGRTTLAVRGESPAWHREWRCARLARRDAEEYRQYSTEEQRSQAGCGAARMQRDFHHGLLVHRRRDPVNGSGARRHNETGTRTQWFSSPSSFP